MNRKLFSLAAGGLAAASLSFAVFAQTPAQAAPADKAADKGPVITPARAVDCSKEPHPERCEARQKAREACQDKRGAERRRCTDEHMPPPDCGRTLNPARCAAMVSAKAACKDKVGPAYRQCVTAQLPPAPAAAPAAAPRKP